MHGKFCSYFEQIDTEDISLENQKTWNHTAGARRCRCRGEASDLLSLPRSQPRGPPYEDWFHETPRARPARLLRTRQREREIHRKSVFDGKAGGGGRRREARSVQRADSWSVGPVLRERLTPSSARKYCYLDRTFRARNMLQNAR